MAKCKLYFESCLQRKVWWWSCFFCFWGFVFFWFLGFFLLRLKYYRRGDSMSEGLEWIQLSNIQRSGNIWACVVVIFLSILNIFLSQAILRPELNVPQPVSKWRHRNEICFLLCVIELHEYIMKQLIFCCFSIPFFSTVMHTFHNCDYILKEKARIFVFIFKCM